MAEAALEYGYSYLGESAFEVGGAGTALRLATSGGHSPNPRLFTGRIVRPVLFADALLAVGAVARSRFHVPAAMLRRVLLLADPVVTAAPDRLRFEAFSSCASVYARLDLLPPATDGRLLGAGTTNVDLGQGLRAALAAVHEDVAMTLDVGLAQVALQVDEARRVERKVALPARWLRGFVEVQAIQAAMEPRFEVSGATARRFLGALPRGARRPVYAVDRDGEIAIGHRPAAGAIALAHADRLRVLERLAPWIACLRVFAEPAGSSAWVAELPDARFTLALSPEAWRGFSGEGRALASLAAPVEPGVVARVRAALAWQSDLRPAALAASLGVDSSQTAAALDALATSGLVGFDLADRAYFHRVLPFAAERIERSQPRLRRARELAAAGAVRFEPDAAGAVVAWVAGRGGEYRVRLSDGAAACTCPWWGKHPGDRGACSHILAAQLAREAAEAR